MRIGTRSGASRAARASRAASAVRALALGGLATAAWVATAWTQAGAVPAQLEDLSWMAGHWVGEAGGVRMEEVWLAPDGGLMLGMHRDVDGSGRAFFEFLRIEATGEGIAYVASPRGAAATSFRLVEQSARRAVFANPEHDFPQRIAYWWDGDRLHARVEGPGKDGELRAEEWTWVKEEAP